MIVNGFHSLRDASPSQLMYSFHFPQQRIGCFSAQNLHRHVDWQFTKAGKVLTACCLCFRLSASAATATICSIAEFHHHIT
jgi:hypothetical protein